MDISKIQLSNITPDVPNPHLVSIQNEHKRKDQINKHTLKNHFSLPVLVSFMGRWLKELGLGGVTWKQEQ